ncbi:MAG: hypothetical protein O3B01_12710 [Planctomycetota bacterium]|nr:hypothetical protein [Planctomycetota bacterium]
MPSPEPESQKKERPRNRGPAWKAAEDYGFDMSLVEANLSKTPAERVRQHCEAVDFALKLRKVMRESRDRS